MTVDLDKVEAEAEANIDSSIETFGGVHALPSSIRKEVFRLARIGQLHDRGGQRMAKLRTPEEIIEEIWPFETEQAGYVYKAIRTAQREAIEAAARRVEARYMDMVAAHEVRAILEDQDDDD